MLKLVFKYRYSGKIQVYRPYILFHQKRRCKTEQYVIQGFYYEKLVLNNDEKIKFVLKYHVSSFQLLSNDRGMFL